MRRRDCLAAVGALGGATLTGCLGRLSTSGSDSWDPTIDGTEPTMSPGSRSTLTVEATAVGAFQFVLPDGQRDESPPVRIGTSLDEVTVSPAPDEGADAYPMIWYWHDRTDVTVETPVTVAPHAIPDTYDYGATVFEDRTGGPSVTESFAIRVEDG